LSSIGGTSTCRHLTASSYAARRLRLAPILVPARRQAMHPTLSAVSRVSISELLGRIEFSYLGMT
jgi:hypothetical protein